VKRVFVVVVVIALAGIAAAALVVRQWDRSSDGEATIRTATLRPGQIPLLLANDSEATTRVAQIILNDVELLTTTGASIDYEIEDAEAA
jgi:hypothetical protein